MEDSAVTISWVLSVTNGKATFKIRMVCSMFDMRNCSS